MKQHQFNLVMEALKASKSYRLLPLFHLSTGVRSPSVFCFYWLMNNADLASGLVE